MEEQQNNKKDRKKILIVSGICLVLIIAIISYTYSIFIVKKSDTGTITGTVASENLSIEVNQVAPFGDHSSKGLVPQRDTAITSAVKGTKSRCVDDNENAVCQVYEVIVTNEGSSIVKLDGIIELNAGENPNLKWALIDSYSDEMTDKPSLLTEANPHSNKKMVSNEEFDKYGTEGATNTYYLVMWISEVEGQQNDTGEFNGLITFETTNDRALNTLQLLNLTDSIQTDTPDFSKVSYSTCSSTDTTCEKTVGIYSAEDDLGTSYYFRGDVNNNYVYFANSYWRIIRINGDGSIRMIYSGQSKVDSNKWLSSSQFKLPPTDNAYIGYMSGTPGVTATGDEGYNLTHSNSTNSIVKTNLDTWYENLSDDDKDKIVDAIYCNDRSLDTSNASYTGIGTTETYYAAYQRLIRESNPKPILTCKNQNDRFTKGLQIENVLGNGKLNAPIGLITADEAVMAGANYHIPNNDLYLHDGGTGFWTMTASSYIKNEYDQMYAELFIVSENNNYSLSTNYVASSANIRPVISLDSEALKNDAVTGNGSIDYPFVLAS